MRDLRRSRGGQTSLGLETGRVVALSVTSVCTGMALGHMRRGNGAQSTQELVGGWGAAPRGLLLVFVGRWAELVLEEGGTQVGRWSSAINPKLHELLV